MPPHSFDADPSSQRARRLTSARTFVLAGAEFRYQAVVGADALDDYAAIGRGEVGDDAQLWTILDTTLLRFLEPGQEDVYRAATATGSGVTWRDLNEVIQWLVGQVVGRPTPPASPSLNGHSQEASDDPSSVAPWQPPDSPAPEPSYP